jgi:hypothetical protein
LIYIALRAADELIGSVVSDVYDSAKKMLRSRREAKKRESGSAGRHLGFTIYDEDGNELASWDIREDEENET